MLPIRRIIVQLKPQNRLFDRAGIYYGVRIEVDAGGTAYAQEFVISNDDFTSRFDWMMDHAQRVIKEAIAKADPQRDLPGPVALSEGPVDWADDRC